MDQETTNRFDELNDRINALSGKLDILLTRSLNSQTKINDLLLRVVHTGGTLAPQQQGSKEEF